MNQKQSSLLITQEQSKNEWRYMLVLLVLGSILGVFVHNSAHKPVLVSDQHAAAAARDVTPKQETPKLLTSPDAAQVSQSTADTTK